MPDKVYDWLEAFQAFMERGSFTDLLLVALLGTLGSPLLIAPFGAGVTSSVGFISAPLAFDFVRSRRSPLSQPPAPLTPTPDRRAQCGRQTNATCWAGVR